jgi:hypothetical protein
VLKQATRFSLLDRDVRSRTLDIHVLVQVVIQTGSQMPNNAFGPSAPYRAVAKVFPNPEFNNWGCARICYRTPKPARA